MKNLFVKLIKDDFGTTAIEYGLVAVGLSFAIIAIAHGIANSMSGLFITLKDSANLLF
jgi:pilus assembly protein Flp/PilA